MLESMGLPLGVVTGTFAAERHEVTFRGQAAHAGSTPMHLRRDALAGAARLALAVRDIARDEGGVGTAGWIQARPGIPNIVPGACALTLDLRHASADTRAHARAQPTRRARIAASTRRSRGDGCGASSGVCGETAQALHEEHDGGDSGASHLGRVVKRAARHLVATAGHLDRARFGERDQRGMERDRIDAPQAPPLDREVLVVGDAAALLVASRQHSRRARRPIHAADRASRRRRRARCSGCRAAPGSSRRCRRRPRRARSRGRRGRAGPRLPWRRGAGASASSRRARPDRET